MELKGIVQSLENKIILVTGSTGYLAKLFVEKLFRVQPNVKHLYLLLRVVDALSPTQRLQNDVMGKEVFRVLRIKHGVGFESFISEKVTPFYGDISLENLGIKGSDLEKKMHKEINIVANFAATTNFQERYDVALAVNTMGAKHVLNFAEKCENMEMILHASTAFVCMRETPGVKFETPLNQIFKDSFKILDMIEEEKKLVQERLDELKVAQFSKKQETAAMIELGLEKALGEMTIGRHLKRNLPVVIVRPTAITSTYREPFPGWIEGFKSLDPVVISIGRGKLPCFIGDHDQSFVDIIPGDMVVNAIIVAMVTNHIFSRGDRDIIYHIGGSTHTEPLLNLLGYAYDYFRENPLMSGDTDEIVKPVFFPTMSSFREHIHNNYVVPMKEQKVQFAKRLAEIYERLMLLKVTFDTSATDRLRMWMKAHSGPEEAVIFDFDPKQINWKDYMMNIHIPGLLKYVVKLPAGYISKL